MAMSTLSEYSRLTSVAVKHARDAFRDAGTIAAQWAVLNYPSPPDLGRAMEEHDRFIEILQSAGASVHRLPPDDRTTLDSIYTRDASIVVPAGAVACRMGKAQRDEEPAAQARAFDRFGVATAGRITAPGTIEGGDLIWLDDGALAVGRGYRTNAAGIAQLRALVGPGIKVVEVPLPHWRGAGDVMHLMSLISPVDYDLAVVYSPH
jgi:N-dimethylarginine dimethylaminohydrolase